MKDYIRDDRTKAVFLCNKTKTQDILEKRKLRNPLRSPLKNLQRNTMFLLAVAKASK